MKKLLFACAMLASTPAFAGFNDGNTFLNTCRENLDSMYCVGYISGLVDALAFEICIPNGVTPGQITATVTQVLRDKPEIRHGNMGQILKIALNDRPLC